MVPGIVGEQGFPDSAVPSLTSSLWPHLGTCGSQPPPQDIPLGWAQHSQKPSDSPGEPERAAQAREAMCGEEKASELQGFIPAGRVPSPLSRTRKRCGTCLLHPGSGTGWSGGSLRPLLMRLRGPGMELPWPRRAPWTSRSSSPGGEQEPQGSPQAHFVHEFPSSTQETWPHFALTRVSSPLFLLLCQKGSQRAKWLEGRFLKQGGR